ncbi:MAG: hypothetical protein CVV27_04030 [Candidatus Melainabacteria bacterium HGW-Melainabacteria-1]|nr:MAG: hypothetical protein CVV27_04030 [Candidatus Melainabacteria bacterium HGW-Melainabacteria-1]
MSFNPLSIPLLTAGLLMLIVAARAWRLRGTQGAGVFILIALASALYILGYAGELSSRDLTGIQAWLQLEYLGISLLPGLTVLFAYRYTGLRPNWPLLSLVAALGLGVLLAQASNTFHRLYFHTIALNTRGPFPVAELSKGPLYGIYLVYVILALVLSSWIFFRIWRQVADAHRRRMSLMLTGALLPFGAEMLYQALPLDWSLDFAPFALTFSSLIFYRGLSHHGLFELAPVARASLFENMADGVLVLDLQGRIADINPVAANYTGLQGQIIGSHFETALPDWPAITQLLPAECVRQPFEFSQPGGRCFELDSLRLADGHSLMIVIRDISARKQAEASLQESHQRLAEANALAQDMARQAERASLAKSEFLANMSHEMRTPLNGVIGMASLLSESQLSPAQQRYADVIRASSESLLALINDILDFSKIEARQLQLEALRFDLPSLLHQTLEMLAEQARAKQLALSLTLDPEIPAALSGDPGRLRQVLLNLGSNAIKFTAKGSVSLQCQITNADAEGVLLCFSVTDTGIGIPLDQQQRLFAPFTQLDSSTTRKYGGTGLGLAISRQLIELMGGKIGLQSEVGTGSRFWFSLHLRRASSAQVSAPPSRPRVSHSAEIAKILLAEDNPVNQEVARAMLEKLGHQVTIVPDGCAALSALRTQLYDLVLMDCQMPEMDGFEACLQLRASTSDALDPAVPVIALTAHALQGDRERCLAAGMNDYLTKPVQIDALDQMLSRWLSLDAHQGSRPDSGSD